MSRYKGRHATKSRRVLSASRDFIYESLLSCFKCGNITYYHLSREQLTSGSCWDDAELFNFIFVGMKEI